MRAVSDTARECATRAPGGDQVSGRISGRGWRTRSVRSSSSGGLQGTLALRVDDITPHAHGLELLIRKSKTDQEGEGQTVFIPLAKSEERCPVKALQAWLELAGIGEGALFPPINRHDRIVRLSPLTPQSVALILKRVMARANGVDSAKHVAGHSLRAGFVTEAASVGMQTSLIMGQSRHSSFEKVLRYIRPARKRQIPSLL